MRGTTRHLSNNCGVYALFAAGRLWYIGETLHLSDRMHHGIAQIRILLDKFNEVQVAFKSTSDKHHSLSLEWRLVRRLRHPMNGPPQTGIFNAY